MNGRMFRRMCAVAWILSLVLRSTGTAAAGPDLAPIKIGSISSLSNGPADFSASALAAKAFLDAVNASGGIQNRKLVFIQKDDQGRPDTAAAAAMNLIADDKVVALIAGASYLECSVNASTYQAAGIVSIPGLGLDNSCFNAAMIAPVNAGPYVQLQLAMRYASEKLGVRRLCVIRLGSPSNVQEGFDAAVRRWTAESGVGLVLDERGVGNRDSSESYLKNALHANCQAVVFGLPAPFVAGFARAGKRILGNNVPLLFIGSAYNSQTAADLGADGDGIYAMSEFEPWSSRSGSLSDWRNLMTLSKIPLTSSSQGRYVAAQVLVHVLRSIKGPIHRESVTQAFLRLQNYEVPMLGAPYFFGKGEAHHPNQAVIPMQLSEGRWRIAHHTWIKW